MKSISSSKIKSILLLAFSEDGRILAGSSIYHNLNNSVLNGFKPHKSLFESMLANHEISNAYVTGTTQKMIEKK